MEIVFVFITGDDFFDEDKEEQDDDDDADGESSAVAAKRMMMMIRLLLLVVVVVVLFFGVHLMTKDGTLKHLFSLFCVATSALDTGYVSRFVLFQNAFHPPLHVPVVHPR